MIAVLLKQAIYERCLDIAFGRILNNFSKEVMERRYSNITDVLAMRREDIAYLKAKGDPHMDFFVLQLESMERIFDDSRETIGTITDPEGNKYTVDVILSSGRKRNE